MNKKLRTLKYCTRLGLLLFAILVSVETTQAQSIQRQSVASAGTYMMADGIMVQQTVGQPYSTVGFYSDELSVHPGYQQSLTMGIDVIDAPLDMHLSLFPNPTSNSVTIECSDVINDAVLQIVDMSGKLIMSEKIAALKTYQIDCQTWNNGFYMISIIDSKNNRHTSKLIITK